MNRLRTILCLAALACLLGGCEAQATNTHFGDFAARAPAKCKPAAATPKAAAAPKVCTGPDCDVPR